MNGESFISVLTKEIQMKQDLISVDRLAFLKYKHPSGRLGLVRCFLSVKVTVK